MNKLIFLQKEKNIFMYKVCRIDKYAWIVKIVL